MLLPKAFDQIVHQALKSVNGVLYDYKERIAIDSMAYFKAKIYAEALISVGEERSDKQVQKAMRVIVSMASSNKLNETEQSAMVNALTAITCSARNQYQAWKLRSC